MFFNSTNCWEGGNIFPNSANSSTLRGQNQFAQILRRFIDDLIFNRIKSARNGSKFIKLPGQNLGNFRVDKKDLFPRNSLAPPFSLSIFHFLSPPGFRINFDTSLKESYSALVE